MIWHPDQNGHTCTTKQVLKLTVFRSHTNSSHLIISPLSPQGNIPTFPLSRTIITSTERWRSISFRQISCMVVFPAAKLILPVVTRNMSPMPPQELSDMIIDYLHDDKAALRSAGLVCKSWFPASRFHLFSDIKLSVYNVHNNGLYEAICAEGSTITPYILHLEIENKSQDAKNVDIALLRLPPFRNLKSLSLGQIQWASLTPGAEKRVTTMAQNLTTLSLCYFTVGHLLSSHLDLSCLIICCIGAV